MTLDDLLHAGACCEWPKGGGLLPSPSATGGPKWSGANSRCGLVYSSYKFNRDRSPEIAADRWARVCGDSAVALEQRYQDEVGVPVVADTPGSITSGDAK